MAVTELRVLSAAHLRFVFFFSFLLFLRLQDAQKTNQGIVPLSSSKKKKKTIQTTNTAFAFHKPTFPVDEEEQ